MILLFPPEIMFHCYGRARRHLMPTRQVPNLHTIHPVTLQYCMQRAIPAWQAKEVPAIVFPGRHFTGHSVLDSVTDEQPKRIPTIFAPFYSGFRFKLAGREVPPGTSLFLTNLTFLVANGTYENLFTSGMMDFFSFGTAARMCVLNRCDLAHSASCARSAAA
jgi:hypothetical protein